MSHDRSIGTRIAPRTHRNHGGPRLRLDDADKSPIHARDTRRQRRSGTDVKRRPRQGRQMMGSGRRPLFKIRPEGEPIARIIKMAQYKLGATSCAQPGTRRSSAGLTDSIRCGDTINATAGVTLSRNALARSATPRASRLSRTVQPPQAPHERGAVVRCPDDFVYGVDPRHRDTRLGPVAPATLKRPRRLQTPGPQHVATISRRRPAFSRCPAFRALPACRHPRSD